MNEHEELIAVSDEDMGKVMGGTRTVSYRVRPRDTIDGIAAQYGVSADDICRWNRISKDGKLPYNLIIYIN